MNVMASWTLQPATNVYSTSVIARAGKDRMLLATSHQLSVLTIGADEHAQPVRGVLVTTTAAGERGGAASSRIIGSDYVPAATTPALILLLVRRELAEEASASAGERRVNFSLHIFGLSSSPDASPESMCRDEQLMPIPFEPWLLTHREGAGAEATAEIVIGATSGALFTFIIDENQTVRATGGTLLSSLRGYESTLNLRSPPLTMDSKALAAERRATAIGYADGTVLVLIEGPSQQPEVRRQVLDGPVSSLCLFSTAPESDGDAECLYLFAGGTIGTKLVFVDVLAHGWSKMVALDPGDEQAAVLCSTVVTTPLEQLQIIVGTHGNALLVYDVLGDSFPLVQRKLFDEPVMGLNTATIERSGRALRASDADAEQLFVTGLSSAHVVDYACSESYGYFVAPGDVGGEEK